MAANIIMNKNYTDDELELYNILVLLRNAYIEEQTASAALRKVFDPGGESERTIKRREVILKMKDFTKDDKNTAGARELLRFIQLVYAVFDILINENREIDTAELIKGVRTISKIQYESKNNDSREPVGPITNAPIGGGGSEDTADSISREDKWEQYY